MKYRSQARAAATALGNPATNPRELCFHAGGEEHESWLKSPAHAASGGDVGVIGGWNRVRASRLPRLRPYYTDYHVWNNDEVVYYHRWAEETHRDRDRDFRRLRPEEQKEYWTWRHNHGDRDHR